MPNPGVRMGDRRRVQNHCLFTRYMQPHPSDTNFKKLQQGAINFSLILSQQYEKFQGLKQKGKESGKGLGEKEVLFLSSAKLQVPFWVLYIVSHLSLKLLDLLFTDKEKEACRIWFVYTWLLDWENDRAGTNIQLFFFFFF